MKRLLGNSRGDTLVEVLIAIGVVGAVIGAAYVSSNRSARAIRTSQERGEALKIAEAQIEQVRIEAAQTPSPLPAAGSDFCYAGSVRYTFSTANCTQTLYTSRISTTNSKTYTVKVTWGSIQSNTTNTVELDYSAR